MATKKTKTTEPIDFNALLQQSVKMAGEQDKAKKEEPKKITEVEGEIKTGFFNKLLFRMFRKNKILVLYITKTGGYYFKYKALSKDKQFIEGDYIVKSENFMRNRKNGAMIVYYEQNPNPLNFKWTDAKISNDDIIITSESLKKYMLQKIWGDFVGNPFSLNMKTVLIVGGIAVVVFIFANIM